MNPFDQLVDDIPCQAYLPLPRTFEPHLWFDGDRFVGYLASFSHLDVATYSHSLFCKHLVIDRLITGLPLSRYGAIKPKRHKHVRNNHAKIFICYKTVKLIRRPKRATIHSVFLGSQNLTSGTNFNLMYKVQQEHQQPIVNFFEQMWRLK